jgi:hypothetical protein
MIVADGFSGNPLLNATSNVTYSYISKSLNANSKFMLGDPFYNVKFNTTAFLFVIATDVSLQDYPCSYFYFKFSIIRYLDIYHFAVLLLHQHLNYVFIDWSLCDHKLWTNQNNASLADVCFNRSWHCYLTSHFLDLILYNKEAAQAKVSRTN